MSRTSDAGYQRNRARLKRTEDTCFWCHEHIPEDAVWPHPLSFTSDHLDPVAKGGHNRGTLVAAH